jgi:glycosyltransferase involved in cell wall biosynthesis
VFLEIPTSDSDESIGRLIDAYGLRDRVRLVETVDPGVPDAIVSAKSSADGITFSIDSPDGRLHLTESRLGGFIERLRHSRSALRRGDDALLADLRIAIVTNQPTHYRIPLFNGMAQRLASVGSTMRVFFLSRHSGSRSWLASHTAPEFSHEFVKSIRLPIRRRMPVVPVSLNTRLRTFNPDVLLVTGFSPFVLPRVARYAGRHNAALGIWSGETSSAQTAKGRSRREFRRRSVGRASFAIAYGAESGEYLYSIGNGLPVVIGRNTAETSKPDVPVVGPPRLLTIGDMATPRKGIDVVITALSRVPNLACTLTIVGGGARLRELRKQAYGDPRITFTGPLSSSATLRMTRSSDVFLFPTRFDIFGLALVEAMGAGLAPIVSANAGAVADLCAPGVNSVVIDGHDPEDWAKAVALLCEDGPLRSALGSRAAETIGSRWTLEHAVDAMIAGLRLSGVTARSRP